MQHSRASIKYSNNTYGYELEVALLFDLPTLLNNQLTPRNEVLVELLKKSQLVTEPERSFPHSQDPTIGLYPEPDESIRRSSTLF
jgi:hypothetical protein